jgi:hypothetical protein
MQRASGASLIRDLTNGGVQDGLGSAAHHEDVLRCARDTS